MSRCYQCGVFGHFKSECPQLNKKGSFGANLKRCYDCNDMVNDLKVHRAVCTHSRKAKSTIQTSNQQENQVKQVQEENQEEEQQQVKQVREKKRAPFGKKEDQKDVYFLLDVSGSMNGSKLRMAKECLTDMVSKMDPLDRLAIVTFDSSAFFKLKPRPVEQILKQNELPGILDRIFARGSTAIYDAINISIDQLKRKDQETIMIVLTDGEDNASKTSYMDVLRKLQDYKNITLTIIHIDGVHNVVYQNLCDGNRGEYIKVQEVQVRVTIDYVFNTYYKKLK